MVDFVKYEPHAAKLTSPSSTRNAVIKLEAGPETFPSTTNSPSSFIGGREYHIDPAQQARPPGPFHDMSDGREYSHVDP